eukprot:GHVN01026740.1.p1 GENE.GHVN01026740.1~~GHVN01026740.1.p1  ORF type:complete len:172 (-),score=22.24 GHVN01026740.1:1213-1728(-)
MRPTNTVDSDSDEEGKNRDRKPQHKQRPSRFRSESEWLRHMLVFGVAAIASGFMSVASFLSHLDNIHINGAQYGFGSMIVCDNRKRKDMAEYVIQANRSAEEVNARWSVIDPLIQQQIQTFEINRSLGPGYKRGWSDKATQPPAVAAERTGATVKRLRDGDALSTPQQTTP